MKKRPVYLPQAILTGFTRKCGLRLGLGRKEALKSNVVKIFGT